MKSRIGPWVKLMDSLETGDHQLREPNAGDDKLGGLLLTFLVSGKVGFISKEGVNRVSEFFPDPLSKVNILLVDDPQRILSAGARILSYPEVFPVRQRFIREAMALHGWSMS